MGKLTHFLWLVKYAYNFLMVYVCMYVFSIVMSVYQTLHLRKISLVGEILLLTLYNIYVKSSILYMGKFTNFRLGHFQLRKLWVYQRVMIDWLVVCSNPSETYDSVSWDYEIPEWKQNKEKNRFHHPGLVTLWCVNYKQTIHPLLGNLRIPPWYNAWRNHPPSSL